MELIFWSALVLVVYIYIGYPVAAWALAGVIGRPVQKGECYPRVTIVIAAYNEEKHVELTIQNKLDQDYPPDRLEIIVVSDASSDCTDELVKGFGARVRLLRQHPRAGKTAALNLAAMQACGEILVFSDANSLYDPNAVRELVANFADPAVGYVTGKMVYTTVEGSLVGEGVSTYMKYENWLRVHESKLAAVIGVDGGIDAVRQSLYTTMRSDQQPDFVLPLSVAERGYRVVYEPRALLKEDALVSHDAEYRMRVRVTLRALWGLWDMRQLMNPIKHGLLAFQLVSHKLLRYLAFVPVLVVFGTSLALAPRGHMYLIVFAIQFLIILLAFFGWLCRPSRSSGIIALPYYFVVLNWACAHALWRFVKRERQATWTPRVG
jgi:cellulose synthase/poly-beta-1,6-N-acetylglucosamine synthase-like glycosyltransferase